MPSIIDAVPRITPDKIASCVLCPIALCDNETSSFGNFEVNLFNAFNDRGTTYGSYTFANDKTTHFVGVIHGHEHTDSFSDTIGFNIIGVTKAYGSLGAVDIFTIDTDNLKLYETRIGDGISREFTFT